jgi:multiple sugar transport system substrate-binding protein
LEYLIFKEEIRMKRLLLSGLFMVMAAGFLFAGAGKQQTGGKNIHLRVYNWGNDQDVAINKASYERFMAANPGITVEDIWVTGTATWSEYITKLLTMISAGDVPDMCMIAIEGAAQLVSNDIMLPIENYLANDPEMTKILGDVASPIVEGLKVDGTSYFFPNIWNGMVMYYNTRMVREAGLNAPPAKWNWNEFREYAKKLTKGEGARKIYGFSLPAYSIFMNMIPYSYGVSVLTPDGKGSNLNDPKVAEAYQMINDMIHIDGSMPVPEQGVDAANLFAAERVAMVPFGHNTIQTIQAAGLNTWDVQYPPLVPGGRYIFGVGGYGILKSTKYPEECWKVIKAIASPETQADIAKAGVSNPVSRTVANTKDALSVCSNAQIFYNIIDQNIKCLPAPVNDSEFEEIMFRYYFQMMNRKQDVAPILQQAHRELQASFDAL